MQRILSVETSRRAGETSSEFVTKRLCCSFVFSVAFIAVLGGFLLGRYTTDKALLLKKASLQQKQQTQLKTSIEVLRNISHSIGIINNLTSLVHFPDSAAYRDFYDGLRCPEPRRTTHVITGEDLPSYHQQVRQSFTENSLTFSLETSRLLHGHLDRLNACFVDVRDYLQAYLVSTGVVNSTAMNI